MKNSYFRLSMDQHRTGDWILSTPRSGSGAEMDPRNFTTGKFYVGPLPELVGIASDGKRIDFNFGAFDMVVSRRDINNALVDLSKIQRLPVTVDGDIPGFEILNVLDTLECFDFQRSVFETWNSRRGRSEKIGQLRMVVDLRIDPNLASGHHIFRVKEWPIALVISNTVKRIFESMAISGLYFVPV